MCPYYILEHLLGICTGVVQLGLRKCQTDFQRACISLHPTNDEGVFLFLHMLRSICCHQIFFFFILAILTGVRGNFGIVLICILLMSKVVEHFFR